MWPVGLGNPPHILRVRRDADTMILVVVSVPVLSRKASSECVHGPYRKPTQVVR